jgi:hypothetical protein
MKTCVGIEEEDLGDKICRILEPKATRDRICIYGHGRYFQLYSFDTGENVQGWKPDYDRLGFSKLDEEYEKFAEKNSISRKEDREVPDILILKSGWSYWRFLVEDGKVTEEYLVPDFKDSIILKKPIKIREFLAIMVEEIGGLESVEYKDEKFDLSEIFVTKDYNDTFKVETELSGIKWLRCGSEKILFEKLIGYSSYFKASKTSDRYWSFKNKIENKKEL